MKKLSVVSLLLICSCGLKVPDSSHRSSTEQPNTSPPLTPGQVFDRFNSSPNYKDGAALVDLIKPFCETKTLQSAYHDIAYTYKFLSDFSIQNVIEYANYLQNTIGNSHKTFRELGEEGYPRPKDIEVFNRLIKPLEKYDYNFSAAYILTPLLIQRTLDKSNSVGLSQDEQSRLLYIMEDYGPIIGNEYSKFTTVPLWFKEGTLNKYYEKNTNFEQDIAQLTQIESEQKEALDLVGRSLLLHISPVKDKEISEEDFKKDLKSLFSKLNMNSVETNSLSGCL